MFQIPYSGEHDPLSGRLKLVKLRKRVKGTRGQNNLRSCAERLQLQIVV